MPSAERISVVRNNAYGTMGVIIHFADGRSVPLLDRRGQPADLSREIAAMRGEDEAQALFERIHRGVSGHASA